MTPMKAIRKFCLDCMGGSARLVRECPSLGCTFFECRFGKKGGKKVKPIKLMRKYCLECVGGSPTEVKRCTMPDCSIYLFRFGKNPNQPKPKQSALFIERRKQNQFSTVKKCPKSVPEGCEVSSKYPRTYKTQLRSWNNRSSAKTKGVDHEKGR